MALLLPGLLMSVVTACGDPPAAKDHSTTSAPSYSLLADQSDALPLEAGSYAFEVNGTSGTLAVLQVPAGFVSYGGWSVGTGTPFHAVGFMEAAGVYPDPCGSVTDTKYDDLEDPGPEVADLADALVDQAGVTTSTPMPITLDGYAGLYLEYQMSPGVNLADCEDQAFDIFTTGPGSWYFEASAATSSTRAAIWILDVDGERLVLSWVATPGVTKAQTTRMDDVVRSVRFVDPT